MLIPAADYLTYAEAVVLYQALHAADVAALVKASGPPTFPFGEGMYYQLWIEEAAAVTARPVVDAFEQERRQPPPPRCPRCGSPEVAPARRVAWWRRLYYAGTNLVECRHCGRIFAA